jgi:hypothetical protein
VERENSNFSMWMKAKGKDGRAQKKSGGDLRIAPVHSQRVEAFVALPATVRPEREHGNKEALHDSALARPLHQAAAALGTGMRSLQHNVQPSKHRTIRLLGKSPREDTLFP